MGEVGSQVLFVDKSYAITLARYKTRIGAAVSYKFFTVRT